MDRIEEIKARLAAATPGPWRWFGNTRTRQAYLATEKWGRHFVMQFWRWGMNGAQPVFRAAYAGDGLQREGRPTSGVMSPLAELAEAKRDVVTNHNDEIVDLAHPDAALIANAPADLAYLIAEVERLTAALAESRAYAGAMVDAATRAEAPR